ncbi:MAG: penicillin-binding protein activator [Fibrobacter sp.]|jgi:ABC-type branched-subunit amino acid transport system substrate-binding protein|nr:penicillin-binding protein activator [Fibrobacter sp.]
MSRRVSFLAVLIFVTGVVFSFAQSAEDSLILQKSIRLIQEGKFAEASPALRLLTQKKITSSAGEKAAVLLAETDLREKKRQEASDLVTRFLIYYTESPYRERMEIIRAVLKIEDAQVYEGVESLLRILVYTENPASRARAKELVTGTLAASLLTSKELLSLWEKYPADKDVSAWILLQLGRESQNEGRYRAARYWYQKVLNLNNDALRETAEAGIHSLKDRGAGIPAVLVLAPLSGEFAEFGVAAIQGIVTAFEQAKLDGKVFLRIEDTRADAATALRQAQQALSQDSVIAIIGPVMSAPSATVAAWLSSHAPQIPMLTPTATDEGIARMGPNIFQINISMDLLAERIADFAMSCLDIHEFAVLSPAGDYGNTMSRGFVRAVERRGGTILAYQNFLEGRPDYKTEIDLLRDVRVKQMSRRQNVARSAKNIDEVNQRDRRSFLADSVIQYPGIFIPVSNPSDAGLMVGQLAFHKLSGTLLGSSGWYGRDLLIQGKQLVNGTYFSVPFADLEKNQNFVTFDSLFKAKWSAEPGEDRVSGLSYDAANIVFSVMNSGNGNLTDRINQRKIFPGVYGEIKFENGANRNSHIVTVYKNRLVGNEQCAPYAPPPAE